MGATSSDIVIVGGVAAGISAASRARRLGRHLEITVLERGPAVFHDASRIPELVAGGQAIPVRDMERLRRDMNVDVRTGCEVASIDPEARSVSMPGHDGGSTLGYRTLILATGARPILPPVEGVNLPGVFTLRTIADGAAVRAWLDRPRVSRVLLVGAGCVGLSMAQALSARGLEVTLIEKRDHLLGFTEPAVARRVHDLLEREGIHVRTEAELASIEVDPAAEERRIVRTTSGAVLSADLIVLATGVEPNVALGREAGVALGESGAFAVDPQQRTSVHGILAAGDCCESAMRVLGTQAWLPQCATANKQGRVAGSTAAGVEDSFPGVVGTAVLRILGIEVARTGLSAAQAKEKGLSPVVAVATAPSRGDRSRGGGTILVAVVADAEDGRLLGAHMVGAEGVALRINVFATALHVGLGVQDVAGLDLAYSRELAPVWDPVLVAASLAHRKVLEAQSGGAESRPARGPRSRSTDTPGGGSEPTARHEA